MVELSQQVELTPTPDQLECTAFKDLMPIPILEALESKISIFYNGVKRLHKLIIYFNSAFSQLFGNH